MVSVALRPVANKLEPANHLAHREETEHFGSDNTDGVPLLAGNVSDLLEHVGRRLLGSAVGLAGHTVHERAGVADEVECGLDIALHCLDGGWCHAALVCNELAELETDTTIVCGAGNDSLYGAH